MGLLLPPRREFDSSASALNGGKLKFFAAGTTTPKNAYPTEADAQADTNGQTEFTADSGGLFPAIYGDDDADYKIRLTDSADVQIWEEDNYPAATATTSNTIDRVNEVINSPLKFGAVGDGVADETTEVQAAIDASSSSLWIVDLGGRTFRCDSQITKPAGTIIRNGHLDFSSCSDTSCILIQGTVGAGTALDSNLTVGDSTFAATSAGISADSWVHITDTNKLDDASTINRGFVSHVRAVSGATHTLTGRAIIGATTAGTGTVYPLSMVSGGGFSNVSFTFADNGSTTGILFDVCEDMYVDFCRFYDMPAKGIEMRLCANMRIGWSTFEDNATASSECIDVRECCRGVKITGCTFRDVDTAIDVGSIPTSGQSGFTLDVVVSNCEFASCKSYGARFRVSTHMVKVLDCQYHGYDGSTADVAFYAQGAETTIRGNEIYACHGVAIDLDCQILTAGETFSQRVSDNDCIACTNATAIIRCDSERQTQLRSLWVTDNYIDEAAGIGISIAPNSDSSFECVHVLGNSVDDPAGVGIQVGGNAGADCENVVIANNTVNDAAVAGIVADGIIDRCSIVGNVVRRSSNSTNPCISVSANNAVLYCTLTGNNLRFGNYGIDAGTTTFINHSSNTFDSPGTANTNGTFDVTVAS